MPFSIAGPVSRHRLALGRIPGLEMDDSIIFPGDAGRQFLSNEQYCSDEALEARQLANGVRLLQTIDWFLEFAPTDNDNDHYKQQFWTLVRDETGISIDRLTPSNLERVYVALQDSRRIFRTRTRQKYPDPKEGKITESEMFFIKLLDGTRFRFANGLSRFQLHYGLRRDDNFGERMATRVVQWRDLRKQHEELLVEFPDIGHDVLPVMQQNQDFMQMAANYAIRFNKVAHKTVVRISADEDVMRYVDVSNDSPKTAMLKKVGMQLANIKADLEDQKLNVESKFHCLGEGMLDHFHAVEDGVEEMREMVDSIKKKQEDYETPLSKIAIDTAEIKSKVSAIMWSVSGK